MADAKDLAGPIGPALVAVTLSAALNLRIFAPDRQTAPPGAAALIEIFALFALGCVPTVTAYFGKAARAGHGARRAPPAFP